ncbi:helix-turn-helix domain-containing protein, partial [Campylobacter fetus]|uniref:helix-turn-helix domain-containing protein n=1 Tax=Campylobacter fetus TaxID=196 RepID=UPI00112F9FBA
MNLAQKIKLLRSEKSWTQEDLAKNSGVSLQSIKLYETGKNNGSTIAILKKFATAFNVNLDFFLNDDFSSSMSSPKNKKKFANSSPIVRQSQNLSPS